MARADGSIIINTGLNTKGLAKDVGSLKSQFSGLGQSVEKLGRLVIATFSVRAIANFGKEAIKLGSDLQEVQNVVDVTFSTMNKQVNDFAKNAAKTAGLSETMAKRYTGTFGAMAKSFGFTEAEAYNMSTALTQLSGDVASFYNLSQDAAYTKLKSVFTGETESLKDLGVVMTQTALDDFALRKGLSKTTSQMTEQEKVALRYQFVLEQLDGASGDFVRTQDSWANQTRILSLQFEQLKATLGQGLINVLTPLLKLLNGLIAKANILAEAFKNMTEALFGDAGDTSTAAETTSAGYSAAAESAEAMAESTENAGKTAKKYLAGFDEITQIDTKKEISTQDGGGLVIDVTPTEIKATAKEASKLAKPFSALQKVFEPLKEISFDNLILSLDNLKNALEPYKNLVLEGLDWLWHDILVPLAKWTIEDLVPAFLDTVSDALKFLSPILKEVKPTLSWIWEDILVPLAEWTIEDLVPAFFDAMSEALSALTPILDAIKPTLSWIWHDILVPMAEYVGQTFIDFLGLLEDAFFALSLWASNNEETIRTIFELFLGFFAGVWAYKTTKKIIEFLAELGPAFVKFGEKLATGGLKSAFFAAAVGILAAGIITLASNWDKLSPAERYITIFGSLAAAATAAAIAVGVFHTAWSVGAAAAAIAGGLALLGLTFAFTDTGDTGDAAKSAADSFYASYDWNKDFSLPALAKGAVLPPNKPFLAMVGDQRHGTNIEAPLETIKQALAEVLAMQEHDEPNWNIHFTGDLAQLGRVLKPVIDKENRRVGNSLVKGAR